jgi:hypothetical protein
MNARSASDDEPLVQPMYWDHPEEDSAYNVPNQFRFGSELIVSPITQRRDNTTHLGAAKLWLPSGRYVDIFTGVVYNRKGDLQVHRPLNQTPAFVREGAIVPLDGAWRPKSGSPNPESLEILLAVGADGSFTLIEDDGTGSQVDDGGFRMIDEEGLEASADKTVHFSYTPITYKQSTGVLKIGPTSPSNPAIPKNRTWKIRLLAHTVSKNTEIRIVSMSPSTKRNAKPVSFTTSYESTGTVITLGSIPTDNSIIMELGPTSSNGPQLDVIDPNRKIWDIVDKAWIEMDQKWDIWNCVNNSEPVLNKVRALGNRGLKQELLDAILELLLADERYAGEGAGDVMDF